MNSLVKKVSQWVWNQMINFCFVMSFFSFRFEIISRNYLDVGLFFKTLHSKSVDAHPNTYLKPLICICFAAILIWIIFLWFIIIFFLICVSNCFILRLLHKLICGKFVSCFSEALGSVLGAFCFCIVSFLSAHIFGATKEWRGRVGYVLSVSEEEGSYW